MTFTADEANAPVRATIVSEGRVTGTQPPVSTIVARTADPATGSPVVTVPARVQTMIAPATAAQLSTMGAPQVKSFVDDLVRKVESAENVVTSEGTGKVAIDAVPVVSPNGTVTAAVSTTPVGWWAQRTDGEKAGVVVGGIAVVGLVTWLIVRK